MHAVFIRLRQQVAAPAQQLRVQPQRPAVRDGQLDGTNDYMFKSMSYLYIVILYTSMAVMPALKENIDWDFLSWKNY